jgi:hypothetical protein
MITKAQEESANMTSELRFLLKTASESKACSDQESLCELLSDLRVVAEDLDLDFAGAKRDAEIITELRDQSPFCPCI